MGRVVHFEIHAQNPQRAAAFYQSVFGWEFQRWSGPFEYWTIKTGPDSSPGINGGLVQRRGAIDGQAVIAFVCTVDVESLDATAAAIAAAGGSVALPKMPVPSIGWLGYFKDTEGNLFGCMQADAKVK